MQHLSIVFALLCFTPSSYAHTGTHPNGLLQSLWHLFSQPSHGLLALGALAILVSLAALAAKKQKSVTRLKRTQAAPK